MHAVIVLKEGEHATEKEIIEFCKQRLAGYKCPKSVEFVKLQDLPVSPIGKILKRELREVLEGVRKERGSVSRANVEG